MTNKLDLPTAVQAVGLACVPVHDMPTGTALARRPVAAAVVTLRPREIGRGMVTSATMSDARELEFPLPWLLDQALSDEAVTLITGEDRQVLALDAAARRYWAEPRLAAVCAGTNTLDPVATFGTGIDERALCRRLQIDCLTDTDSDVERSWNHTAPTAAIDVALSVAVARLMLWAHGAAFEVSAPQAFFETMLPLLAWLMDEEKSSPGLQLALRSRPMARAFSFATTYQAYRTARDAGDETARWVTFEAGLFHS